MEMRRWWWWLPLIVAVAAVREVNSDPQTHRLGDGGCSSTLAKNATEFQNNLKATFSELRSQLASNKRYATAQRNTSSYSSDSTYAMAQCRNYMSQTEVAEVAQCALNVTQDGCRGCLTAAFQGLKESCLDYTSADGRVVDAACFMRYSNASFFPDNQTTDIDRFLKLAEGMNEKALIGGTVGGAVLVVIVVTAFIWYKFSRQLKMALIGNILGATELQRPNTYSYTDLKEATNNFSEDNKLGKGAFGAVYKARLRNETIVAVKKLDMRHSRVKEDFEGEVRLIIK